MSKEKPVTPNANVELVKDTCAIIEQAQKFAHHAVNETLIKRNWLLGMRIQKEVLKDKRAGYGDLVISALSKKNLLNVMDEDLTKAICICSCNSLQTILKFSNQ